MQVSAIYVYPVKSCGGQMLSQAVVTRRGFKDDRELMVTTPDGRCLTQREQPRLALIKAKMQTGQVLTLTAPGRPPFSLIVSSLNRRRLTVTIRNEHCQAVDQGEEVAGWLTACLETPCRLVRMADDFVRQIEPGYGRRPEAQIAFADRFPFRLISQASLNDLNSRLAQPVEANRFRPNLVVAGCEPYAEDGWKAIRIGDIVFDVVAPGEIGTLAEIDRRTASHEGEPLQTLAGYRQRDDKILFGQNLIHCGMGTIRVGAKVELLE